MLCHFVLSFPICSPIYLYCSPVMLCCHFNVIFNIAIKAGGSACHTTRLNPPFLSLPRQEYGHCYIIIVRFCGCYIVTLCFCCVVCFLLHLSVNSHYYKTCHGTFLSQIHLFSFDKFIVFCVLLSWFLCVLRYNVVSLFSSYI